MSYSNGFYKIFFFWVVDEDWLVDVNFYELVFFVEEGGFIFSSEFNYAFIKFDHFESEFASVNESFVHFDWTGVSDSPREFYLTSFVLGC